MKVKVLKDFIDKDSKKNQKVGEVIEISQDRFKEINGSSHGIMVEPVIEDNQDKEVKEVKEDPKPKKAKGKKGLKDITEDALKDANKEVIVADTKPTTQTTKK